MGDTWGGSWGSSWGLSWTQSGVTPPTPDPDPVPTTPGGAGTVGGRLAYRKKGKGRTNAPGVWADEYRREQERLARLSDKLTRKKDRAETEKAVETIAKAVAQLPDDYYSARLLEAMGLAAEATKPRQIVRLTRAAAEAAEMALIDMLAEAIDEPPRYEMTDWDRAAILLLS